MAEEFEQTLQESLDEIIGYPETHDFEAEKGKILATHHKAIQQAEREARIDELEELLKKQEAMIIHGAVFAEMKQKWVVRAKLIEDRIKQLKGESK